MVFIRDLCQNASSTALQCRYRRFSLIQIPGLLFSSTRCLFIKCCPYLNRSVSICKEPLIIYFCRSTFCTSCRCRRDRVRYAPPSSLHARAREPPCRPALPRPRPAYGKPATWTYPPWDGSVAAAACSAALRSVRSVRASGYTLCSVSTVRRGCSFRAWR